MLYNDKMSTPKGGPRAGAGRKPRHGARKIERTVRMLPETWTIVARSAKANKCSQSEVIETLLRMCLELAKLQ
jgi:hypothetical protein